MVTEQTWKMGRRQISLLSEIIKILSLFSSKTEQVCCELFKSLGGFLSSRFHCMHRIYLGHSALPLWALLERGGQENQLEHEAHAACCDVINRSFVSDSRVSCLLPASIKLWQDDLLLG